MQQAHVAAATFQGKCPRCGQGNLFDGFLNITVRCDQCDLDLSEHDCGDGPIFFVMSILCFTVVPAAVALELFLEPSVWVHILLWPVICFAGSLLLLRPLRGLFTALKYKHVDD